MHCSCGSSGALDGHSPFCDLRRVGDVLDPPANRVLVGLPDRLNTAKTELARIERVLADVTVLLGQRKILKDSVVLDQIAERLGLQPFVPCKHPNASRDSRGDVYCFDCKEYLR